MYIETKQVDHVLDLVKSAMIKVLHIDWSNALNVFINAADILMSRTYEGEAIMVGKLNWV